MTEKREILNLLDNENPLSNFDVMKICKFLNINLDAVSMNNQIKSNWFNKNFSIIVNLEDIGDKGSHWVAFYNNAKTKSVYYMDSYGEVCNQHPYNLIIKKEFNLYFNKKQFQSMDSSLCGWFCIYFLYCMQKGNDNLKSMAYFLNLMNYEDYEKNDKIIKNLMKKLIKSQ